MFQESFIDAAIIAQNLLNDPLDISTCDNDITMLSTALSFNQHGVPDSYLSQIMETLIIYPGATESSLKNLNF